MFEMCVPTFKLQVLINTCLHLDYHGSRILSGVDLYVGGSGSENERET